jgi:hypothetical protein
MNCLSVKRSKQSPHKSANTKSVPCDVTICQGRQQLPCEMHRCGGKTRKRDLLLPTGLQSPAMPSEAPRLNVWECNHHPEIK